MYNNITGKLEIPLSWAFIGHWTARLILPAQGFWHEYYNEAHLFAFDSSQWTFIWIYWGGHDKKRFTYYFGYCECLLGWISIIQKIFIILVEMSQWKKYTGYNQITISLFFWISWWSQFKWTLGNSGGGGLEQRMALWNRQ